MQQISWHAARLRYFLWLRGILSYYNIMSVKLFLVLATVLLCLRAYELEGEVLVLGDDDFPSVIEDNKYVLVEFYAPWCGHCKHLAPVFLEAAAALKEAGSEIKLAKVDATVHKTMSAEYGVKGFPTLFFFVNGSRIDYKGDRTKEGIIAWTNKKILPVTTEISDEDSYNALSKEDTVSVVLFPASEEQVAAFEALAIGDEYSRFYIARGGLLEKGTQGTVKLVRNFDKEAVFHGDISKLKRWVEKHSRPSVLPFDQRTIGSIFSEAKQAFIFINTGNDESLKLKEKVEKLAKEHEGELVFTEIEKSNEHFTRFAEYIKLNVDQPRVLIVDGGNQKKYLHSGSLSHKSIEKFLEKFLAGEAKQVGLTDAAEEEAAAEVEATEEL